MSSTTTSSFVANMQRASNVRRFSLMSQFKEELLSTHIYETTFIGHLLGVIEKDVFGNSDINPSTVALQCLYHELSETSGASDVLAIFKYANPDIAKHIKSVEHQLEQEAIASLPEEIQSSVSQFVHVDKTDIHAQLSKSADVIATYAKAAFEMNKNNLEFSAAFEQLTQQLDDYAAVHRSVAYFKDVFIPALGEPIDNQVGSDWRSNSNAMNLKVCK